MTSASLPVQAVEDGSCVDVDGQGCLVSCEMVRWRNWTLTLLVQTCRHQSHVRLASADRLTRLQPSSVRGEKGETNTAKLSQDRIGCSCFASQLW